MINYIDIYKSDYPISTWVEYCEELGVSEDSEMLRLTVIGVKVIE